MTPESFLEPELQQDGDRIIISGIVTHRTVMKLWQKGLLSIKNGVKELSIDLSGLTQCDSSGLALCTAWSRAAAKAGKKLIFINVPKFVQDLLRVYSLDKVLEIKN